MRISPVRSIISRLLTRSMMGIALLLKLRFGLLPPRDDRMIERTFRADLKGCSRFLQNLRFLILSFLSPKWLCAMIFSTKSFELLRTDDWRCLGKKTLRSALRKQARVEPRWSESNYWPLIKQKSDFISACKNIPARGRCQGDLVNRRMRQTCGLALLKR